MTRHDVIRRIVDLDKREQDLREDVVQREATDLYELACEHFGTWDTALCYAGVNLQRLDRDGSEAVKLAIQRLSHGTYNLTATRVRQRNPKLHRAALKHFGTWRRAVRAAGIDPDHIHPYSKSRSPTRQQILRALVKRKRQGRSLRWVDIRRENYAFAVATKNRFGSWGAALVAAGVVSKDSG